MIIKWAHQVCLIILNENFWNIMQLITLGLLVIIEMNSNLFASILPQQHQSSSENMSYECILML